MTKLSPIPSINKHKLKPYKIPNDFVLIIDTREQKPLFPRTKGLVKVVNTLNTGDYSIKGFEDQFCIERKADSDLYSFIGKERKRTVAKLEKMSQYKFAGLVIENSFDDLMMPNTYSEVSPESVRQFLISVQVRYGIHVFVSGKRKWCENFVLDSAIKFFNISKEV